MVQLGLTLRREQVAYWHLAPASKPLQLLLVIASRVSTFQTSLGPQLVLLLPNFKCNLKGGPPKGYSSKHDGLCDFLEPTTFLEETSPKQSIVSFICLFAFVLTFPRGCLETFGSRFEVEPHMEP